MLSLATSAAAVAAISQTWRRHSCFQRCVAQIQQILSKSSVVKSCKASSNFFSTPASQRFDSVWESVHLLLSVAQPICRQTTWQIAVFNVSGHKGPLPACLVLTVSCRGCFSHCHPAWLVPLTVRSAILNSFIVNSGIRLSLKVKE